MRLWLLDGCGMRSKPEADVGVGRCVDDVYYVKCRIEM